MTRRDFLESLLVAWQPHSNFAPSRKSLAHIPLGEREDQEMEEQGEVQHDVDVRTTRWGYG
ncbi:hypothetical protein EYF80_018019 [Liparis tanakae]|uniref:Uncharacterized protein n=1 Tax=Liparis tanakae TaxID=230148 RepID=A0A4Z2I180_9TELE|nr:hypothetical protein EYF80_018019 [Liparis tanakae]